MPSGRKKIEMSNKSKNSLLLYLYCVTTDRPNINESAECIDDPFHINYNDLYAVVSYVSSNDFSDEHLENNLSNLEWLEKKARFHDKTINEIMKGNNISALIPFKFATVFFDEDSLNSFLNNYYEALKTNLDFLRNKEEWGVKIYYDKSLLEIDILKNDAEIKKIDMEINASPSGKAFLLKRKKQELLKNLLHNKAKEYGNECYHLLKKISDKIKINNLQKKELTGKDSEMILNIIFLVGKDNIPFFCDTISNLKKRFESKGFEIDCTGPWPTYNFCSIEEKKDTY
jgi:hypothetical protein